MTISDGSNQLNSEGSYPLAGTNHQGVGDTRALLDEVDRYAEQLHEVLESWDTWLFQEQERCLAGESKEPQELESQGGAIIGSISELLERRATILATAKRSGLDALSLTHLVKLCDLSDQSRIQTLERLTRRVRSIQQHNLSAWVTSHQLGSHVAAQRYLLATGASSSATYHPEEERTREGGQMIDSAA